jgi:nitrogen fixation protein FixH
MTVKRWVAASVVVAVGVLLLWPRDPGATTVTGRTEQYTVDLTVDHPKQGANTLDFEVTDTAGRPATVDTIAVELVMPQMGHALPPVSATRTEPGRYRASNTDIPMSGVWEVTVSLPGSEDVVLTLPVT